MNDHWVLEGMARQLSRLDRREWSPTFGCFDRDFWKYKTLSEFPRLTFQQPTLSLALLYKHPLQGNIYYQQPEVLRWIEAAILFWIQHKNADGSVDEWYANERSFCATAHTAYALGESALLLLPELSSATRAQMQASFARTGEWLAGQENLLVANQMAASLLSLHSIYELTQAAQISVGYRRRKAQLLDMQSSEGWFQEYGGADIGYSFLTLDLLAHLWQRSGDADFVQPMERLVKFLSEFVRADGYAGGELGSRGTCHFFPYGLKLLARAGNPLAQKILGQLQGAALQGKLPSPAAVDDVYSAYFYLNSFCQALTIDTGQGDLPELSQEAKVTGVVLFPEAGLWIQRTPAYEAVFSAGRGGLLSIFSRSHGAFADAGYFLRLTTGQWISNQGVFKKSALQVATTRLLNIECSSEFSVVDTSLPMVRYGLAFRFFARYILCLPGLSLFFSQWLKKKKVTRARTAGSSSGVYLRRKISFLEHSLTVEDRIELPQGVAIEKVLRTKTGTLLHSPSSGLFTAEDLASRLLPLTKEEKELRFTYHLDFNAPVSACAATFSAH